MLFLCCKILTLPFFLPQADKLEETFVRSVWRVKHKKIIQMFISTHVKSFHSFEYEVTNVFFLDVISSGTIAIINSAITQSRVCNTYTTLKFSFLQFIFSIIFLKLNHLFSVFLSFSGREFN